MYYLPRYWRRSVSGGSSEGSYSTHLPRYSSDAPPAAVFVEKRVRCAVRCTISLSPPLFSPPKKKSHPRSAPSRAPRSRCRPARCAARNPVRGLPRRSSAGKKVKKKSRKIWRFGKKQYLCNPVRREGHLRCPGARGKEASERFRTDMGSSLTRLEEAVQAKYRKQIRER